MRDPAKQSHKHKSTAKKIQYLLEYLAFQLIISLLQIMSWRMTVRLSRWLACVVHHWLPQKWTRYQVVTENLERAFGEELNEEQRNLIIEAMWIHFFRMIGEMAQLPRKLHRSTNGEIISFRNRDETVQTFCSGRPVMMLSGHFGNWEIGTSAFGLFGFPMALIARDLDNPYLHRWFQQFRQSTGHHVLSKKGATIHLPDHLKRGGFLGLLGDQNAGRKGLFVDFFSTPASTFKSIALMSLQFQACITVSYARRLPDEPSHRGTQHWAHYELGTEEIIDPGEFTGRKAIREITQEYTSVLERIIRKNPEQYFWLHRRWKSQPGSRTRSNKKPTEEASVKQTQQPIPASVEQSPPWESVEESSRVA